MLKFRSLRVVEKVGLVNSINFRRMETLVSTSWLNEKLKQGGAENLKIVQASWSNCKDYNESHIPGSVCFDGDVCRDQKSPYKNMLPTPEEFAAYVGEKLGIDNKTDVLIYDANNDSPLIFYATRLWYMFRVFGHDRVGLLNGGFKRWLEEKYAVTNEVTKVLPKKFKSNFRRDLVLSYEDVVDRVVKENKIQLVDARSPDRYKGIGKDPYGKEGHIKNALNVYVQSVLDQKTKLVRTKLELEQIFKDGGINISAPLATSCGTGITATGTAFAAFLLGKKDVPVYDGSWYEWVRRAPDEYIVKN